MVQAVVAGVGGLLGLIGAILTIVVAVGQDFVVVSFPPVEECDENYLGTLGVYKATYDPACAKDDPNPASQALQAFERTESPVTEFWPLFPSFTNFGGAFGEAPEGLEFTTCEEFYAAGGPAQQIAAPAAVGVLAASQISTISSSYEELEGTAAVVSLGVAGYLKSFVADEAIPGAFEEAVDGLQTAAAGAAGLIAVLTNFISLSVSGAGCPLGATFLSPFGACAGPAPVSLFFTGAVTLTGGAGAGWPSILAAGEAGLTSTAVAALAGPLMLTGTEPENRAAIDTIMGIIGLHGPAPGAGLVTPTTLLPEMVVLPAGTPGPAIFGDVVSKNASSETDDFTSVATATSQIYGAALALGAPGLPAVAALGPAIAAFGLCPPMTPIIVNNCSDAVLAGAGLPNEPVTMSNDDPNPLCLVASAAPQFNETSLFGTDPADCTFLAFLLALPEALSSGALVLPPGILPDDLNPATLFPALTALLTSCADYSANTGVNVTFARCISSLYDPFALLTTLSLADQSTIPENMDAPLFALCNGLALSGLSCGANVTDLTFRNFILTVAANGAAFDLSDGEASALAGIFGGACAGTSSWATCQVILVTPNPLLAELQSSLAGAALDQIPGLSASAEENIKGCNDDLKDKEVFERAQKLVPVCIVLSALGAILAMAAGFLNKTPVAFVAGGFMVFGGVLLMITLILVRGAPVYGLVGGDPTPYEPLYSASGGQILALMGVALPIVGGIMLVVSAFLNKPGAEDALSNKVDAA